MKITILIQEDKNVAGPIINQQRLAFQHRKNGHEIQILCLYSCEDNLPIFNNLKDSGFNCSKKNIYNDTKDLIHWIIIQVKKFKTDFFICDWIVPGIFASHWIKKGGIPCVCSHLSDHPYFWKIMHYFAAPKNEKWKVSGVACISKYLRNELQRKYQGQSVTTYYIPSTTLPSSDVVSCHNKLRIVYCGRLEIEAKQIVKLTDSFCDLVTRIPDSTATIIGDGPHENEIISLINKRNCSEKIKLLGRISNDKVQKELSKHNVIVLLSDYEGLPTAVLDGMSVGLVPVCLKCPGGVDELVIHGKTGLLVKNRKEDFQEKLLYLLNNPTLFKQLSKSAINHVKNNYSVENVANKWIDFYHILSKGKKKYKNVRVPIWIKLPKINEKGFIIENYSTMQYLISSLRIKLGSFIKFRIQR